LILKIYCYIYIDVLFYLSVKAIINFVITLEFKEFSTRQLLMTMFGFTTVNLLDTLNITITVSINFVTIPQRFIFQLICDFFSLTSVTSLGFHFTILCCLNNYFPLFYCTLLLIEITNVYLLYIYHVSQCAPYFGKRGLCRRNFWLKITSVMSTLLYINRPRIINIYLQYMFWGQVIQ
jgi:hypothetical protein